MKRLNLLSEIRIQNYYPNWPAQFSACKKCEFKKDDSTGRSDLSYRVLNTVLKHNTNGPTPILVPPNIFNVWDLKDPKLMEQGLLLFKSQLTPEDIKYKEAAGKLDRTERQWLANRKRT